MPEKLIWTKAASKIYNLNLPDEMVALDNADISINKGEFVVLKGPSGSGKTSLLSIIGCMSRPTAGQVVVNGKDVAKLPERFLTGIRHKTFGFIFQQFNLIRDISVRENVSLPLYPDSTGFKDINARVDRILAELDILSKKKVKVKKLSGGEQQRVAIARALINNPEILIADEPTAHLDQKLASELLVILARLHRKGRTVIIASHDPLVCQHDSVEKTISMRNGHIEETLVTRP